MKGAPIRLCECRGTREEATIDTFGMVKMKRGVETVAYVFKLEDAQAFAGLPALLAENAAMRAFIQKWAGIIYAGPGQEPWANDFCIEADALLATDPSDG